MLKTILFTIFIFSSGVFATNSMRKCVVLPVIDTFKNSIAPRVYDQVEDYLKNSNWCYYRSNAGLFDILSRYQHRLDEYLKNPKVLSVIANKTGAGSLIYIGLSSSSAGITVEIIIYGENGSDIYFKEKTLYNSLDLEIVSQTIRNWLEEYNRSIPYDVRVSGVLGDDITIDMGSSAGINSGDEIEIIRPTKKKRHPLFKEVVDWETKAIAKAKVVHTTLQQAKAKILKYKNVRDHVQLEDWGIIKKTTSLDRSHLPDSEKDEFKFGKLGKINFSGSLNNFSVAINTTSTKQKKGMMFGGGIDSEIWITREYWIGLGIKFRLGSLSTDQGSFSEDSSSLYTVNYNIRAGYRYLPLGFFYGPQFDLYMGYKADNISLDNKVADGLVAVTYSGLALGAKANIPIYKKIRLYSLFEFLLFSSFKEDITVAGEPDGVSSFHFKLGGSYNYKPNFDFTGGIDLESSKASYDSTSSNITHKNIALEFGAEFTF